MKLIKGEFKERLDLLFAPSIKAGFPSSADDYLRDSCREAEKTGYGGLHRGCDL